jgi:hypothetical protein
MLVPRSTRCGVSSNTMDSVRVVLELRGAVSGNTSATSKGYRNGVPHFKSNGSGKRSVEAVEVLPSNVVYMLFVRFLPWTSRQRPLYRIPSILGACLPFTGCPERRKSCTMDLERRGLCLLPVTRLRHLCQALPCQLTVSPFIQRIPLPSPLTRLCHV